MDKGLKEGISISNAPIYLIMYGISSSHYRYL